MSSGPSVHLAERAARRLREAAALAGAPAEPRPAEPPPRIARIPLPPAAPGTLDMPAIELAVLERAGMIGSAGSRDRASEEFRLVQGQLLQNLPDAGSAPGANLVMLTSARPGEGKSFAALNLAAATARYGKRAVLLVDCDSVPDPLTDRMGLADAPGLLDLAADPARTPREMVVRTALPNLAVLPIGGGVGRNALSVSVSLAGAIEELARCFLGSIILLDAPPCLSSSDPAALAAIVGQIVMVVEAERTQRSELESALELVQACPTVMLLLNKTRLSGGDTFGAYFESYSPTSPRT